MLVLAPSLFSRNTDFVNKEFPNSVMHYKLRLDYVKELGGQVRGYFQNLGFVCEFPDHLYEEWKEILGLIYFS